MLSQSGSILSVYIVVKFQLMFCLKVFEEACKDEQSPGLNIFDFKVVLSKSPDFAL